MSLEFKTLKQLKEDCLLFNLPTRGTKEELLERLKAFCENCNYADLKVVYSAKPSDERKTEKTRKKKTRRKLHVDKMIADEAAGVETQVVKMDAGEYFVEFSCKICFDEQRQVVFLPCGHLVCCKICSNLVKKCPICRNEIAEVQEIFL